MNRLCCLHFSSIIVVAMIESCWSKSVGVFDFMEYNDTNFDINWMECARRVLRKSGDAVGCKKNVASSLITGIQRSSWCAYRTMSADNVYMEAENVTYFPTLITDHTGSSWTFRHYIPICMSTGARIDMLLTPRTGWTKVNINIMDDNEDIPFKLVLRMTSADTLVKSTFAGVDYNKHTGPTVNWVTDDTYHVGIVYNDKSYTIYLNYSLYHVFNMTVPYNNPVTLRVNLNLVYSDIHYVKYRK